MIYTNNLFFSWIFNFENLPMSGYKPIDNLQFIEHLITWFICTHEIQEKLYPTINIDSTVTMFNFFIESSLLLTKDRKTVIYMTKKCSAKEKKYHILCFRIS